MQRAERAIVTVQGATYVASGLWPLIHYRSFTAVTGPKREPWLVKTVGLLIVTIGSALLVGSRAGESRTARTLGIGSSLVLGSISGTYATKRRIAPVYFLDAALEGSFLAGWAIALSRKVLGTARCR